MTIPSLVINCLIPYLPFTAILLEPFLGFKSNPCIDGLGIVDWIKQKFGLKKQGKLESIKARDSKIFELAK